MASEISKKDFLKRYLENNADGGGKRKKKPKSVKPKANVPCLKIVDRDIDLKSINFGEKADEDEDDEAPVVAEIIDERPKEVQLNEIYDSSHWKKVNYNDSSQSDMSVLQKTSRNRHDSDSDESPVRKQKRHSDSDMSPPRSQKHIRHDSDGDISPPRSHKQRLNKHNSDSDISPPRTHKQNKNHDTSVSPSSHKSINRQNTQMKASSRRYDSNSDISPPRHQSVYKQKSRHKNSSRRHDSDSDHSPTRLQSTNFRESKNQKCQNSDSDISPPRPSSESSDKSKKLAKTLTGLKAGLQNSKALQQEVQELKKRERNHLNMLDDEISGRNADTIIRDRKTGLKRDLNKEQKSKDEEDKKVKEYQKKYDRWGKGTEQTQEKMKKFEDDLYETTKPLARYKDDKDLDESLKAVIHDEDPMSEYIKKKRKKNMSDYPIYSGPPAPPNRFGLKPGYRWDGVDRSNGFEKKYFEKVNNSKAVQDEAYMWSIQDM